MTNCTGIILAAGRGSRLGSMTDERPKCLIELGGRTLLDWQLTALAEAGVESVHVVTGYRQEMIAAKGVSTITNPDWASSNMVASLMCAVERLSPPFIVSYSDIVYHSSLVRRLAETTHDLAVTYDLDWRALWERRFEDPLSDAETFRIDENDRIQEIGGKPRDVTDIQGQFMGLLKLDEPAVNWIKELVNTDQKARFGLHSTGLLERLIKAGKPVHGVPTRGGWCEIDDAQDLAVAMDLLEEGLLADSPEEGVR
jgi:L-glutamine-phosphate cytidylyltransferase